MKKFVVLFVCTFLLLPSLFAQAEVIKFDRLNELVKGKGDGLRVINFWATWCGPCVKELPYFETVAANNSRVDIFLVSLDFVEQLDRVNAFIKKKALHSTVFLLDEVDYNSWIDKVDPTWSGAIPATLLINPATGDRKFIEKELQEGELEKYIEELSN